MQSLFLIFDLVLIWNLDLWFLDLLLGAPLSPERGFWVVQSVILPIDHKVSVSIRKYATICIEEVN